MLLSFQLALDDPKLNGQPQCQRVNCPPFQLPVAHRIPQKTPTTIPRLSQLTSTADILMYSVNAIWNYGPHIIHEFGQTFDTFKIAGCVTEPHMFIVPIWQRAILNWPSGLSILILKGLPPVFNSTASTCKSFHRRAHLGKSNLVPILPPLNLLLVSSWVGGISNHSLHLLEKKHVPIKIDKLGLGKGHFRLQKPKKYQKKNRPWKEEPRPQQNVFWPKKKWATYETDPIYPSQVWFVAGALPLSHPSAGGSKRRIGRTRRLCECKHTTCEGQKKQDRRAASCPATYLGCQYNSDHLATGGPECLAVPPRRS